MSYDTFHINEKAILLPAPLRKTTGLAPIYFGTEVTVVSALLPVRGCEGGHAYTVETYDGELLQVVPKLLQKKPRSDNKPALDSDETPNAPAKFDPAIWAPSAEVVL